MTRWPPNSDRIDLLLVEDREADVELTRQSLEEIGAPIKVHVVRDGVETIAFLRHKSSFRHAPRPHLILLDLNLPRMDGREVLAEIKHDPLLRIVPVVILTTSAADRDVCAAYEHHANGYMIKPVEFDRFVDVIRSIGDYWLRVVTLPPRK
jgi:CheY-like chemotaxis protein